MGVTSCSKDDPELLETVKMPISICLPVSDVYESQCAPELRAFGDPGTTELFALPQYIYYFIVKQNANETWEVWDVQTKSVNDETGSAEEKLNAWKAKWDTIPYDGLYHNKEDMVYMFKDEIVTVLPEPRFNGRVYAVASSIPLTFNTTIAKGNPLATLLDLTFTCDGSSAEQEDVTSVVNNLQNIFSTPYNYEYKGEYYGSFSKDAKVPELNLLLYHVAAKVDLIWNVDKEKRSSVKINHVEVIDLYQGPCLVFRPTENQVAALYTTTGYSKVILNTLSPGTQWNGRKYFYTIPYKNNESPTPHYPLRMKLLKAEAEPSGDYYFSTVDTEVPPVWVPWIRGQISIVNEDYNYHPTP